jgi:hypothetical protein
MGVLSMARESDTATHSCHGSKWYSDLAARCGHPGFVTALEISVQEFEDLHPGESLAWIHEIETDEVNLDVGIQDR